MDFLNQAFSQTGDLLRTMSPPARLTTGLLLAVVVLSLVFLFRVERDQAGDFLFGAEVLTQREIDTMTGAFGTAGLNDYQVEGSRLSVPRSQRHIYMAALVEGNALPEHPGAAAEEVFRSTNPLESRDMRERKARRAKERDLESTVRKLVGIDEAFVSFESIDLGGFPPRKEQRALVSVRAVGRSTLDEQLVRSIRQAVAFGGGVESDNVTVLDLNSGLAFAGKGPEGRPFGEDNAYAEALRRYERMYRDKIEVLLSMIPGVRVDVFVELDKNLTTRTTTQKYDTQPVAVRTQEYQKDSSTNTPQNQGRPGAASNNVGNTPQAVATTSGIESTTTETRSEADNLAGATQEFIEQAGLVPEYVKAAIYVPRSYFHKVWQEENPAPPGDALPEPDRTALKSIETRVTTDIQEAVAALLPEPAPGVDKFPRISVKTFTETPLPSPPGPSMTDHATAWFAANWQTMGLFALAIAGAPTLRSMLKAGPIDNAAVLSVENRKIPIDQLVGQEEVEHEPLDDEDDDDDDEINSLKARFRNSGRSLRDELGELVKEDPDAAANVLQNWIGDAA